MAERTESKRDSKRDAGDSDRRLLAVPLDTALFRGDVDVGVVLFHENERPLAGLAGLMDWRLHGAISHHLKSGAITGAEGECVYAPATRHGRTIHLLLLGAGPSETPGARTLPSATVLKALKKNLSGLAIGKVGISRTDWGGAADTELTDLKDELKGVPLWLAQ